MIRMARVGIDLINELADPDTFVRAVHVTGDLEHLGQGTDDDQRWFVTVADERTILHFGSSYGGNALLGKIAHGLRQAAYDGWASREFLSEQFMLIGITDRETGKKWHVCGGFPSASGKTNLAMMLSPDGLGDRYHVEFYGDDIAWLWVGDDGRLYGMNPEFGVFGVAKDTNERTNPTALESVAEGTQVLFTNVAYNDRHPRGVVGGQDAHAAGRPHRLARLEGREDRRPVLARRLAVGPPQQPVHDHAGQRPQRRRGLRGPAGRPDRRRSSSAAAPATASRWSVRSPTSPRASTTASRSGAEATAAADGKEGLLRYDPMSMRPFMSYAEGDYAAHWLRIVGAATEQPIFAHVNWFQKDPDDGHFVWPGYRDNLRPLLWLMRLKDGEVTGRPTPVGILPTAGGARPRPAWTSPSRTSTGCSPSTPTAGARRWASARSTCASSTDLPEEIWEAHRRVAAALDSE